VSEKASNAEHLRVVKLMITQPLIAIEAVQWDESISTLKALGGIPYTAHDGHGQRPGWCHNLRIRASGGTCRVDRGDWIVRQGNEFSVLSDDDFPHMRDLARYEADAVPPKEVDPHAYATWKANLINILTRNVKNAGPVQMNEAVDRAFKMGFKMGEAAAESEGGQS
jgi:hypothetical protein